MTLIIAQLMNITFVFSTALIFAAMGGIFSERSGVIALSLEGYMIGGAFLAAVSAHMYEQFGWGAASAYLAFVTAMIAGILLALIHALATVTYGADQVVSGVVINFLAAGLSIFLVKVLYEGAGQTPTLKTAVFSKWTIPYLADLPLLGPGLFRMYPTTYLALLIVALTAWVLWRTPFGLRLRSLGEHPAAAASLGISVSRYRYIGVIISGALAALGGATITLTTTGNFSHATIAGQGFIALAAMIFGQWKPFWVLLAALFFGMATGLKNIIQLYPWARDIPTEWIYMLPYVLTLIVLSSAISRARPPKALGEAYDPARR